MEWIACPLCSHGEHALVYRRFDHTHHASDEKFAIVRCRNCSFVFVNPRPSEAEISIYYPQEFYEVNLSPAELLEQKRRTLDARLAMVSGQPPGKVLDIGCQKGEFLYRMQRLGWTVEGVEVSSTPPNMFGLPICYGRLRDVPFADHSFDLVTLWAVLEHVHDPMNTLRQVARVLKPTGRALVLVPNFNSIPGRLLRHDDVPRHLLMFTPRTLKRAATSAGLDVTRIVFSDDIFSGSTRGTLNFLWKLMRGETYDEILEQNRSVERWTEFTRCIHGKPSRLMGLVDRWDLALSPRLDRWMNYLGVGFIMTAELVMTSARRHTQN